MSGYTKDGIEIFHAYDINGNYLSQAYDINGNEIFHNEIPEGKERLSVMSYNVQWFTNINSQLNMQREILNKNEPVIIGCQELSQDGTMPLIGQTLFSDYPVKLLSNHKNYLGCISMLDLYDTVIADYQNQDPEDMSQYGETRSYIKTYFNFNCKRICWINTHLSYRTNYTYTQMSEILELISNEEYFIITADFNTNFTSFTSDYYNNTYKKFLDAGCKLINSIPSTGITKTYTASTYAELLSQFSSNPDNIIVSSNIDIYSINFDITKLFYLDGHSIDHIAVNAVLLI